MPLACSVTFALGLGVGIYLHFLALFLPGYTGWEITDLARHTNGVGIDLQLIEPTIHYTILKQTKFVLKWAQTGPSRPHDPDPPYRR